MSRIWLPLTTLLLHITHGLQLPSFTALRHTHFHPPLHQLHSCHQSLINPDCLTTPAPHSHTHTFKQHSYMHSPRSLVLAPADISERFPCILFTWTAYILWPFAACLFDSACLSISSLSAACPDICIAPVADSALPTWHLLLPLICNEEAVRLRSKCSFNEQQGKDKQAGVRGNNRSCRIKH